jgi:hypothetical protein
MPASWDEAMNLIVKKAKQSKIEKGTNSIAIYSTGQGFLFKQAACKIEKVRKEHQVASGESLDTIAEQYGCW